MSENMLGRRQAAAVLGAFAVLCPSVFALNPSLEVNQYGHTAWTVRDGFFKSGINAICQDRGSYLLLGSELGLLRFDGVRPVSWPADEQIARSDIRTVFAASDGRIWIGMALGLSSWKNGQRTDYPELTGQRVLSILEDRQATIWVAGYAIPTGRLCAFRDGEAHCTGMADEFSRGTTALYQSPTGELWAGAANGLWRWRPDPPKRYSTSGIRALARGSGSILIVMQRGIRQLLGEEVRPYPPLATYQLTILSLLEDRDGDLWVGTDGGGLLHVRQNRVDRFTRSDGLSGDSVNSIFEDREGSIWVGTDAGVDRFRDFAVPSIGVKQGLSSAAVNGVLAARDGSIWLGTLDGLDRWTGGKITIYKRPGRLPVKGEATARVILANNLPDDNVQATFEDTERRIWICSPHGLAYFDSGKLTRVSTEPHGFVSTIAGDGSGNLWVSDEYNGLIHYSGTRKVEQVAWANLGRSDYASAMVTVPSVNGVWLGFRNGDVAYYSDGRLLKQYTAKDGLGKGSINGLTLDANGTLWASTEGGLSRIQPGRVVTLTSRNGLPCNAVNWMAEDQNLSVWIYTACGLARIHRSELMAWFSNPAYVVKLMILDGSDGVISHSLTTASSAVGHLSGPSMAPDGKLWFSTINGADFVDPRDLPFNNLPPPVHVYRILGDGKEYDIAPGLRLPPLVRNLALDFVGLSLVAPEKNRYRFKLEGWDSEWRKAVNEFRVEYSNLPPRHYRFRVIASNNSGVWNETGDSLDFSIEPAYYQTKWFYSLCVAACLALLWLLYLLRVRQLAREFNAHVEGRVNERMRVARDLHDTLLQSFQGLIPMFQTARTLLPAQPARAAAVLDDSLREATDAIVEARNAIQELRSSSPEDLDLSSLLSAAGQELARLMDANGSVPALRIVVEGSPRPLTPLLQDEIYRIGREALRNAFRHAHADHVEAEIRYDNGVFRLRIRDDGGGIDSSVLEQGARPGHWGLPGMRERAKGMGGRLKVWSEAGAGTEVELAVPARIAYANSPQTKVRKPSAASDSPTEANRKL
jgi:signal transduction histidine kinase/ligand-binding sensor domain-containing protein